MKIQASHYRNKKGQLHFRVMMDKEQATELTKVKGDGIVKEFTSALSTAVKASEAEQE